MLFMRPESYKETLKMLNFDMILFSIATFSIAMGFATSVLFCSTTIMLLRNRTTIENQTLLRKNPFDKGFRENWKEVFGH